MARRILIGLLVALAAAGSFAGVASAHAELVSSTPAAGAQLTAAPATVTLVFDEEISEKPTESFFTVTDSAGATVGTGALDTVDLDHKTLTATLKSGLGDGVYTVTWQTLTVDDNGTSEGSFTFGVRAEPAAAQAAATATPAPAATAARPTATPAANATQPTPTPAAAPAALPRTADDGLGRVVAALALGALLLAGIGWLVARRVRVG